MKKRKSIVGVLLLIVVICVSSYIYFNQQKAFEQFLKFREDYAKTKDGDITIYKAHEVLFDTDAVFKRLEPTRQLAQDIFKMEFSTHERGRYFGEVYHYDIKMYEIEREKISTFRNL